MENNTPEQITQNNIFVLTQEEFSNYFEKNIRPKLNKIMRFMKILDVIFMEGNSSEPGCIVGFVAVIPLVIWTCLLTPGRLPLPNSIKEKLAYLMNTYSASPVILLFILLGLFTWLFLVLWPYLVKIVFDKPAKKIIFKELGFGYYDGMSYYSDFEYIAKHFAPKLFRVDEMLRGKYAGQEIVIIDCAEKGASRKIFIATKIDRKFSAQTLIETKNAITIPFFDGEQVNLEDVEFSKVYNVSADDQVEARYILTPTFMERLLKYNQKNKGEVQVFFSDKISPKYNIFFSIPVNDNWFELPNETGNFSFCKFIHPVWFYSFLQDIKEIMQIVEALKLDQDIGM